MQPEVKINSNLHLLFCVPKTTNTATYTNSLFSCISISALYSSVIDTSTINSVPSLLHFTSITALFHNKSNMEQDMKMLNGEISERSTFLDENGVVQKQKGHPAKSFRRKVIETLVLYLGFIVVVSIIQVFLSSK